MLKWYIFSAKLNGETVHEKIPAESWTKAKEELKRLGYVCIVCEDFFRY